MERRTSAPDDLRRIDTVGTALRYFATVLVVLIAGTLILGELGISIAPILATAGVAGSPSASARRASLKDYFSGFFLCWRTDPEGDVVEVAEKGRPGGGSDPALCPPARREGYVHFVPTARSSWCEPPPELRLRDDRRRDLRHESLEPASRDAARSARRCAGPEIRAGHPGGRWKSSASSAGSCGPQPSLPDQDACRTKKTACGASSSGAWWAPSGSRGQSALAHSERHCARRRAGCEDEDVRRKLGGSGAAAEWHGPSVGVGPEGRSLTGKTGVRWLW